MESTLKENDLAVRGQEYTDKHTKKQTRHSMNTIMSEECYYDAHDGILNIDMILLIVQVFY